MAQYSRRVISQPNRVEYYLPAESNWAEVGKLLSAIRNEINRTNDDAVWTRVTEEELIFWFNQYTTPLTFDAAHGAHFSMRVNPNRILGDAVVSLHFQTGERIQLRIQDNDDRNKWTAAILSGNDIDVLVAKLIEMKESLASDSEDS